MEVATRSMCTTRIKALCIRHLRLKNVFYYLTSRAPSLVTPAAR